MWRETRHAPTTLCWEQRQNTDQPWTVQNIGEHNLQSSALYCIKIEAAQSHVDNEYYDRYDDDQYDEDVAVLPAPTRQVLLLQLSFNVIVGHLDPLLLDGLQ